MTDFLFIDDVEDLAFHELTQPPMGIHLPWWPRFNEIHGGLRMHEYTVLTAETGAGKTTILANLVVQALLQSHGCYVCSAEVGNALFLIAMYSALERRSLGSGERIPEDMARDLRARYSRLLRAGRLVFSRHDDWIEPSILTAEMEKAVREFHTKFMILDNLQFFTKPASSNAERAEQDKTIREFKRFVKRNPAHALLIAHPRKGGIDSEDAIKGSLTVSQEADNVWLIHRPSEDEQKDFALYPSDRRLQFRKIRRRGWNSRKSIVFRFDEGAYLEKEESRWGARP